MKSLLLMAFALWSLSADAQPKQKIMNNPKPYTILVLMNAKASWLTLSRNERALFFEKEVVPAFRKVSATVTVRLFDSEYFHAGVSDFMVIETQCLDDYQQLIERLRDTKIYAAPYFEIRDIIMGQENRFEDFNEQFKAEKP
ncbi:hypothetical protein JMG10_00840 [Nostoc ellipsosporum NOK]|nr:hypothetical protein [Nostoc ellipsosporum NOK]